MSANYLESNLKRIAAENKELTDGLRRSYRPDYPEVRFSKDGFPVPVLDNRCLHSPYDPAAEAAQWVTSLALKPEDGAYYLLGGLGFGYHLTELLKIIPPERLIVIERDPVLAASALAHRPPEVFPQGLHFIIGESPVQAYHSTRRLCPSEDEKFVFIEHPASSRANPDYYRTLAGIVQVQSVARRGGYNILLVSPLYGGSLPVVKYVHRALTELGHRCEVLDNSIFYPGLQHLEGLTPKRIHQGQLRGLLTTLLAESISARALEIRVDLVIVLAQAPVSIEVLSELKKAGIRTAFWFIEDGQIFEYWKQFAPQFDHYFVIQKGEFFASLKAAGCQNPYYLPLAADPEIHHPLELIPEEQEIFGSDLSHVGAGYYNRRHFFSGLLDLDFKIWGNDWENPGPLTQVIQRYGQRVTTEESVKIFNATGVNINLHSSAYHDGIDPFGDFLNPRTYEIAACSAFQLVDERQYLRENFADQTEIVTFTSLKDVREKVDYYLANPLKRLEIAGAARQRVLGEHTYSHRMLEMLGVIAGQNPGWVPRNGGLPTAEEIIAQVGEQSELGRIMQQFTERGPLSLDGVAAEIESARWRPGEELNRTEAMILLLNEFRRWGQEKGVL